MLTNSANKVAKITSIPRFPTTLDPVVKRTDTDHRTGGNGHRFPHAKTSFEATGARLNSIDSLATLKSPERFFFFNIGRRFRE